jgi:hypothetical protein
MPDWFTQSAGRDIKPRCHVPDVDLDHHEAMCRRKSEMKMKQGENNVHSSAECAAPMRGRYARIQLT